MICKLQKCLDLTIEAWKQLIRVMDDIHEGTRTAATSTAKTLSKVYIYKKKILLFLIYFKNVIFMFSYV